MASSGKRHQSEFESMTVASLEAACWSFVSVIRSMRSSAFLRGAGLAVELRGPLRSMVKDEELVWR